jgi:hypothetical protein
LHVLRQLLQAWQVDRAMILSSTKVQRDAHCEQVHVWGSSAQHAVTDQDDRTTAPGSVKAIAAGSDHAVALLTSGSVVAWGENDNGKIDVPASTMADMVASGYRTSFALRRLQGVSSRAGSEDAP